MKKLDRLLLREWVALGGIVGFLATLALISWTSEKRAASLTADYAVHHKQEIVKRKIKKSRGAWEKEREKIEEASSRVNF